MEWPLIRRSRHLRRVPVTLYFRSIERKEMTQRLATAFIVLVAVTIVASGLPLYSVLGVGSGVLGFFNLSLVF
jgi:hypothetical protein